MSEILYLDLFFLVNLAADLYLLVLTAVLGKACTWKRAGRLLGGAAAGAVSACALVFLPKLPLLPWKLLELMLLSWLMLRIAFGACSRAEWFRRLLSLWMAATLTGGICSLLEPVAGRTSGAVWELTSWSLLQFGKGLGVAGGVLFGGARFLRQGEVFRNNLYEVTLYYQGRTKTVLALRDTGNQLYEPYGHQPVHVLEKRACGELLEEECQVLYVPFTSVGNSHGILPAVRLDRMEVRQKGKLVWELERPWVALSGEALSPHNRYGMLLHGEISQGKIFCPRHHNMERPGRMEK